MTASRLAPVLVVLAVAAGLRLHGLETNPPGLWQDEASSGLDAYLLWHTGRDRAGVRFPVIAASLGYGDFPIAGYRYLLAPIVGIFGLTPGNERLGAALVSFAMVPVTALLALRLFGRRAALATLVVGALCPTWIQFARYGSEAILLPFCLVSGWLLIEHGRTRRASIWAGAVMLAASAYTYHAVKLHLPLFMLGFLVYAFPLVRELWRGGERRHVIGPALVFAALVLPSVRAAITPEGMSRGEMVLAWYRYSGVELARVMLANYLSYYDPSMLFVRGGPHLSQAIPGIGTWSALDLPGVLAGLYVAFSGKGPGRALGFVLYWFAIGPIPGGITYEAQNLGRAIGWLPSAQLLSGVGLGFLAERLASTRLAIPGAVAFWAAAAGISVALAHQIFVRYPLVAQRDYQLEISRALACAGEARRPDERIVVSNEFPVAEVFARFWLDPLPPPGRAPVYTVDRRTVVGERELYVVPAYGARPPGDVVCEIQYHGGQLASLVLGPPGRAPKRL